MKDDPIGAALRDLPRERAGDQFTGRVLARLGERRRPTGGAWALRGALTAGALTAVLAAGLWLRPPEPATPAPAETTTVAATAPQPAPPAAPTDSGNAAATTTDSSPPAPINTTAPIATAAPIAVAAAGPPATAPETAPATAPRTAPAAAASQLAELAEIRAELAALRREHRRFAAELSAMPEIGHEGAPVLYLGGDEGLDLVLDLGRDDLLPGPGDGPPRQRG